VQRNLHDSQHTASDLRSLSLGICQQQRLCNCFRSTKTQTANSSIWKTAALQRSTTEGYFFCFCWWGQN